MPTIDPALLKKNLALISEKLGFTFMGVAPFTPPTHASNFQEWVDQGKGAGMDWLTRQTDKRLNPHLVLPEGKSVIVLGTRYAPFPRDKHDYEVSAYALGLDYHDILDERLRSLNEVLEQHGGTQRFYSDTGPVLERDFAQMAGLGWCGKSNLFIHPQWGSATFLSVILTTLDLPKDTPLPSRCGFCTRCLDSCPTGALTQTHDLNAQLCLAYWTIEHAGSIPLEMRPKIGHRLYGCDACLQACPWNRKKGDGTDLRFRLNEALFRKPLREFLSWTDQDFSKAFKKSPIKRLKLPRFLRNVCVVLGNTGTLDDIPHLTPLTQSENPLIAEHASWAIHKINRRGHPPQGGG